MPLSREDILKHTTLARATVSIPEWGGDILVREATAAERSDYETSLIQTKYVEQEDGTTKSVPVENYVNHKARLVVKCVIDEVGTRLLTDEDATNVGLLSAAIVSRLFQKIQELSGMTKKAVDDVRKN